VDEVYDVILPHVPAYIGMRRNPRTSKIRMGNKFVSPNYIFIMLILSDGGRIAACLSGKIGKEVLYGINRRRTPPFGQISD
jgi:hypothetical protein